MITLYGKDEMKRTILITGFSGFVSRNFIEFAISNRLDIKIYGIDIAEPGFPMERYKEKISIDFRMLDLLNQEGLKAYLEEIRPDYILHLASFSSVAYSWKNPRLSFINNTNIFLNLVLSIYELGLKSRILSVGSSEEYGKYTEEDMPLREEYPLHPCSPYAVARVSQEMLSQIYAQAYGVDIILTRSFNHIGPWQDGRFVVASFIKKTLEIKKSGEKKGVIEVGDLSIVRDFVDVRDVVRAYWMLLCQGKAGEVYNICSGKGIKLGSVLEEIGNILQVDVTGRSVKEYIRPEDNKVVIGSYEKIYRELGWKPQIELRETLKDVVRTLVSQ